MTNEEIQFHCDLIYKVSTLMTTAYTEHEMKFSKPMPEVYGEMGSLLLNFIEGILEEKENENL